MHISMAIISMPEGMGTVEAMWRMRFIFCRIGFVQSESATCRFMWQNYILFLNRANLFLCFQGNRIKIREEKYRIHHADMMFANRSIQICIPEVIKIS